MAPTSSSLLGRQVVRRLPGRASRSIQSLAATAGSSGSQHVCRRQNRSALTVPSPASFKATESRVVDVSFKGICPGAKLCSSVSSGSCPRHMAKFSTAQMEQKLPIPDPIVQPIIHDLYEEQTATWQYIVADPTTLAAVIIDSVLDYNALTRTISTQSADKILSLIEEKGYKVDSILETHIHADHITAARYLQSSLYRKQGYLPLITVGKRIVHVQHLFRRKYGLSEDETEGVFNKFLDDDETFRIGALEAQAIHLPGHTPDHMGFKIGGKLSTPPHVESSADKLADAAEDLYTSGRKLLDFPEDVRLWTGHDYPSGSRGVPVPFLSVGEHKAHNKHLMDGNTKDEFVALRHDRDSKLAEPRLLHQSLQMNIRAGRLPRPSPLGDRMLHTPLNVGVLDI
ncbi:hypothetical protein ED733_003483 [Metarhizium rileyi]|uniref:Metallo-beta-lactamase domain-containing protein n=1 Tax=Metarhizium rileyi (strain RCEF 4871) TaxID=1649241 RepID=A0A5C6G631_METRR|nr:hypothetical protein ED733_003483 [Metarhizium rileyi]